jgi:hypothetical protein
VRALRSVHSFPAALQPAVRELPHCRELPGQGETETADCASTQSQALPLLVKSGHVLAETLSQCPSLSQVLTLRYVLKHLDGCLLRNPNEMSTSGSSGAQILCDAILGATPLTMIAARPAELTAASSSSGGQGSAFALVPPPPPPSSASPWSSAAEDPPPPGPAGQQPASAPVHSQRTPLAQLSHRPPPHSTTAPDSSTRGPPPTALSCRPSPRK